MKKIVTAINNPILNQKLLNEKNIKIIGKDIQYKEAILELLEKENDINLLIISEKLPGQIDTIELIKNIKKYNIKIIFILEKQNYELEEKLKKEQVDSIYYNSKITIDKIIDIVKNDSIDDTEDIKKEIEILKEIVLKKDEENTKKQVYIKLKNRIRNVVKNFKKSYKKMDKKQKKIITFCGSDCVGKSSIIATFCKINIENVRKILIINFNEKNDDIFLMFFNRKRERNETADLQKFTDKKDINLKKIDNKISILDGKSLIQNEDLDEEKFKNLISKYDLIYVENSIHKTRKAEEKILNLSDKIICICETNIINISKNKKILENYINNYFIKEEKINILFNKYNKFSIEEKILEKIFFNLNIIGIIKNNNKNNYLINTNYKNISKLIKIKYKKILNKIIFN